MRVLLIKMSSLGDVIHTLPAVTEAGKNGVRFDWVVEEAFADIAAAHPAVHNVIPIAWRRWRKNMRANRGVMAEFYRSLRTQPYDMVLDSQGLIKSAAVALMAKGPRQGFSHTVAREPWAAFAYGQGHCIPRAQHAIDRQRQLFASVFGYELGGDVDAGLELDQSSAEKSVQSSALRQVFLLHGTTWQTKHWPVVMWQALARDVSAAGFEPVVTWGNEIERQRAELIAQDGVARVVPRMPLAQLSELIAQAVVVIGVDSGLCHLSAALGTPTLGLYGPTDGVLTGCRGPYANVLTADLGCSPCLHSSCKKYSGEPLQWQGEQIEPACFAAMTPKRVWQAAQDLIENS